MATLTLQPPDCRQDERHEQRGRQRHADGRHDVVPVPPDDAMSRELFARVLAVLRDALFSAARAVGLGQDVDRAQDERLGPGAAEVGHGVEQLQCVSYAPHGTEADQLSESKVGRDKGEVAHVLSCMCPRSTGRRSACGTR